MVTRERVAHVIVAPLLLARRLRLMSFLAGGQALSLVPGALGLLTAKIVGWSLGWPATVSPSAMAS